MFGMPGQYSLSTRAQDPRHRLGARVQDFNGRIMRYGRASAAISPRQLVGPRIYATITTGITATAGTTIFVSSGSTFLTRLTDNTGRVTRWEEPARGSLLHVTLGTGKQQFARVTNVLSATKLGVEVISSADGAWATTLASTATVRIIEPVVAAYDTDSMTLPPYGVALGAVATDEFAFFGCSGAFRGIPNTTVLGTPLIPGPTAGQLEPAAIVGSATWDPASIADGDEEVKEVTATGAALGDYVIASFSIDVADLALVAAVTAADTVTAQLLNNTGGAIDLGSGTVRVKVDKRTATSHEVGTLLSPPGTAADAGVVLFNLLAGVHGDWYF